MGRLSWIIRGLNVITSILVCPGGDQEGWPQRCWKGFEDVTLLALERRRRLSARNASIAAEKGRKWVPAPP